MLVGLIGIWLTGLSGTLAFASALAEDRPIFELLANHEVMLHPLGSCVEVYNPTAAAIALATLEPGCDALDTGTAIDTQLLIAPDQTLVLAPAMGLAPSGRLRIDRVYSIDQALLDHTSCQVQPGETAPSWEQPWRAACCSPPPPADAPESWSDHERAGAAPLPSGLSSDDTESGSKPAPPASNLEAHDDQLPSRMSGCTDTSTDNTIDPTQDLDGDGWSIADGDCWDSAEYPDAALVYPGAPESCEDTYDNDCNGLYNDGCANPIGYATIQGGGGCATAGHPGSPPSPITPGTLVLTLTSLMFACRSREVC